MLKKTLVWIGMVIIAAGFAGFGLSKKAAPAAAPVKSSAWPGVPNRPVTAYEFARAHGREVLVMNDGVCDWEKTLGLIEKYKIAEKEISVEKGREIFEAATFGDRRPPLVAPPLPFHGLGIGAGRGATFTTILCYEPHHILIFRDESGLPVKALEICITCEKWRASSTIDKSERGKMDVAKLKATFGELGLLHSVDYDKVQPDEDMEPVSSGSPFPPAPADSK